MDLPKLTIIKKHSLNLFSNMLFWFLFCQILKIYWLFSCICRTLSQEKMKGSIPLQVLLYATLIRSLKVISKRGSGRTAVMVFKSNSMLIKINFQYTSNRIIEEKQLNLILLWHWPCLNVHLLVYSDTSI